MSSDTLSSTDPIAPVPPADDLAAKFAEAENRRRQLEEELEVVKAEASRLADQILDQWAMSGQQSATILGLTIYVSHEFTCWKKSDFTTPDVCRRLEDVGLGDLVAPSYNAMRLKAFVKESIDQDRPVPEQLVECLQYETIPRLRSRRK